MMTNAFFSPTQIAMVVSLTWRTIIIIKISTMNRMDYNLLQKKTHIFFFSKFHLFYCFKKIKYYLLLLFTLIIYLVLKSERERFEIEIKRIDCPLDSCSSLFCSIIILLNVFEDLCDKKRRIVYKFS